MTAIEKMLRRDAPMLSLTLAGIRDDIVMQVVSGEYKPFVRSEKVEKSQVVHEPLEVSSGIVYLGRSVRFFDRLNDLLNDCWISFGNGVCRPIVLVHSVDTIHITNDGLSYKTVVTRIEVSPGVDFKTRRYLMSDEIPENWKIIMNPLAKASKEEM